MDRGSKRLLLVAILGAVLYAGLNLQIHWRNRAVDLREEEYQRGLELMRRDDWFHAVPHYHKAAEQGHMKAQINLGVAYIEGRGVAANPEEACYWFGQALQQQPDARNYANLSSCYAVGLQEALPAALYLAAAQDQLPPEDWQGLSLWRDEVVAQLSAAEQEALAAHVHKLRQSAWRELHQVAQASRKHKTSRKP